MTRKFTDDELENALKYDPLASAEQLTGKSYKNDINTALGGVELLQRNATAKEILLKDAGDVYWGMEWDDYLCLLIDNGFFPVYSEIFFPKEPPAHDYLWVLWNRQKHILLVCDTYGGHINGGNFHYCLRITDNTNYFRYTSSGQWRGDCWVGSHDCREAVLYHIRQLETVGEFVSWVPPNKVWLTHHGDKSDDDQTTKWDFTSYYRKSLERWLKLPVKVQRDCAFDRQVFDDIIVSQTKQKDQP